MNIEAEIREAQKLMIESHGTREHEILRLHVRVLESQRVTEDDIPYANEAYYAEQN